MHPWWPNTKPPEGTGPWPQRALADEGRSGSISLAAAEQVTNAKLCGFDWSEPTSVVVEVAVTLASSGAEVDIGAEETGLPSAQLILEYGSGGVARVVTMDLRSGSYQLPPCEQVRVLVTTAPLEGGPVALKISGCLVKGQHPNPTTPTYTYTNVVPVASPATVTVPDAARFVDVWVTDSQLLYGSGAPRISAYGAIGSQVVRDYANAIWAPPFPAALVAGSSRALTLATTVEKRCVVQFELEL